MKVACFCENAIEGKDGVFTLVRIVDVITHTAQGRAVSDEMPPVQYGLKMVIMIAPGMARGRHTLTIETESPMGLRATDQVFSVSIHFEEGRTANLIIDFAFTFELEGTYLFHVSLDDDHLTTMPLTIRYNRIMAGS
jgi:hypothetical protein